MLGKPTFNRVTELKSHRVGLKCLRYKAKWTWGGLRSFISALLRQRQAEFCGSEASLVHSEFQASQHYIVILKRPKSKQDVIQGVEEMTQKSTS